MNLAHKNVRNISILFKSFNQQISQGLKSIVLPIRPTKILFSMVLLICSNSQAFASEIDHQITIEAFSDQSFILNLPSEATSTFEVTVSDINGTTLLNEKLESNIRKRKYNLKNLPSGKYIISIAYDHTIKWQHILLNNGTVEILEEDLQSLIQPTVSLKGSYLDLNMLCFSNSKIIVQIWDNDGHLLSEEILNSNGTIQKRYNLNHLQSGKYLLNIALEEGQIYFDYEQRINWTADKLPKQ